MYHKTCDVVKLCSGHGHNLCSLEDIATHTLDSPIDHSRGERTGVPDNVDTTSRIHHSFHTLDMHLTDREVALTKLNVGPMSAM